MATAPMLEDLTPIEDELLAEQEPDPLEKLFRLASSSGNFAGAIDATDLAKIGNDVCEDYDQDDKDRADWKKTAEEALDAAAQEFEGVEKTYPWPKASNIHYPILTSAMLQFNARAYPAVVKGDEAVLCKVIGRDTGRPLTGPAGPVMGINGQPVPPQMIQQMPPEMQQQLQPIWQVPPGGKSKRAQRVSEYMNTTIFYRMEDWESDTDSLLMQLPVVGCVFRKVWYDPQTGKQRAAMVSALRIVVPEGARSLETAQRVTEEIPDIYPHQISADIRNDRYIDVDLFTKVVDGKEVIADEDKPRLLLEQHRLMDLDEDGLPEPYIVTVDYETHKVLRIEANFGPDDVKMSPDGRVMSIAKGKFFIKYPFFPHPKGKFYDIGLGHLLKQMGDVIDTAINQLMDAGNAQTAGGGFLASGVRLQGRAQGSVIKTSPGKWTTVDVSGSTLREAMVPFTQPEVSSVTFQMLDLILGAAKDLSGIKDVITGEASNTGQVGTTLALIEQGLQVFNAIYKRVFRAAKEEFQLLYDNIGKYGGEVAERDYLETLDDPEADFKGDFSSQDLDIRPVSDPSSVTRMQKMAKAQFLLGLAEPLAASGGDVREVMHRVLEAADIDDIDKILPEKKGPDPREEMMQQMQMAMAQQGFDTDQQAKMAKAMRDITAAAKQRAETEQIQFGVAKEATQAGMEMGAIAA